MLDCAPELMFTDASWNSWQATSASTAYPGRTHQFLAFDSLIIMSALTVRQRYIFGAKIIHANRNFRIPTGGGRFDRRFADRQVRRSFRSSGSRRPRGGTQS